MNIILGEENLTGIDEKYMVLELDTIRVRDHDPIKAFCLVEKMPVGEMFGAENFRELHSNLITNYRLRNWNYCEQAIEHLLGKWNGELDTFYLDLVTRIQQHRAHPPGDDWDGVIDKNQDQSIS